MVRTLTGKAKARAELLFGDIDEEIVGLKRAIVSAKDKLPNLHAEFASECKNKIERLANAVIDSSNCDSSVPQVAVQANAQPEPLASQPGL